MPSTGILRNKSDIVYKYTCLLLIAAIVIALFIHAIVSAPTEAESPSYVLPVIAIENRLSYFINQSDIDAARIAFPRTWGNVYEFGDLFSSKLKVADDGRWYSFYFITYSVACIPMHLLFKVVGIDQMLAFPITNLILYSASLLVVYFLLNRSLKIKLITILLLICNPIVFYMNWVSMEVFLFSMVVMAFVFFSNNAYKRAGLFISIAGSMNVTIMVCGIAMILHYFITMIIQYKSIISLVKNKWKDIILYACCFLPGLLPFVLGLSAVTTDTLGTAIAGNNMSGTVSRAIAYLLDLNFGLLPYFTITLLMYICTTVYGLFKRDYSTLCYLIAFFGTIFAFSLMTHINSGMTGIARYNAWVSPIMIFYVAVHGIELIGNKELLKYSVLTYFGAGLTLFIICMYLDTNAVFRGSVNHHMPVAKLVLNNVPQLYNPLYSTFVSRTLHIDGGYTYTEPVLYTDIEGNIRKILVTPENAMQLHEMVFGNDVGINFIEDQIRSISQRRGYQYINIPRYSDILLYKKPPLGINASTGLGEEGLISGNYPWEGDFWWCMQEARITLLAGNKSVHGMQMTISIDPSWFVANNGKEFELQFIIDGEHAMNYFTETPGLHEINVEPHLFPESQPNAIYQIELRANGYFDPAAMPEVYGDDVPSRNLSFMLFSFEESIYIIDFEPPLGINASLEIGERGFVSGNYPREADFYWCEQDVVIVLGAGEKAANGMQIEINLDPSWFIANDEKEFELQFIIDGKYAMSYFAETPGLHDINVESYLFPASQANAIYQIELRANGYFDPAAMPEVYGDNAPSRNLSFMLFSFEESIYRIDFEPPLGINASLGMGESGFVSGNYPREVDFYWCRQDVVIVLEAGEKADLGMQMEINLEASWFIANDEKEFELQFIINGQQVKRFTTFEPGMHSIIVEPSLIPPVTQDNLYHVALKANGHFDPSGMPELFGPNVESRKLSFMLYSFEEIRR